MSYVIDTIENDEQPVRSYEGRNGKTYVFRVTTSEGAVMEVGKLKGKPQKGDVYTEIRMPSEKAPEGAVPTLYKQDYDASPPPLPGSQNGGNGGHTYAGSNNRSDFPTARDLAIQRQHSQEMALRAMALSKDWGVVTGTSDLDAETFRAVIKKWTDWFAGDVTP